MHEYIFVYSNIVIKNSLTIVGLINDSSTGEILNKPALNYKGIRILRDENLGRQMSVYIEHNKEHDIKPLVTEVKETIKKRIKMLKDFMDYKLNPGSKIGSLFSFAIAPENDRWDIVGTRTYNKSDHGLKIVKNFNRNEAEIFVPVKKIIKTCNENSLEEIQEEVFKYIEEQEELIIKSHG